MNKYTFCTKAMYKEFWLSEKRKSDMMRKKSHAEKLLRLVIGQIGLTFGGMRMDTFMDKLAQKLNAQEIIKANTAADTEELNRLKNQVAQYNECLDRLRRLIDESTEEMKEASQESAAGISRLLEESLAKIREIKQESAETTDDKVNGLTDSVNSHFDNLNTLLDSVGTQLDGIHTQLDQMDQAQENRKDDELEERFAAVEENVHKECVKVYRNVQAVVVEESGKQTKALEELTAKVNSFNGKLGAVLGISIAALVFALAGTVLQVLNSLGMNLF